MPSESADAGEGCERIFSFGIATVSPLLTISRRWNLRVVVILLISLVLLDSMQASGLSAQEHAERAYHFMQSQKYSQAEVELRQAVSKAPGNAAYLSDLGSALRAQKKLKEAEQYYRQALKFAPDNDAVLRNLALTQWDGEDLLAARTTLETALRLKPKDPTTVLMLGVISERLHDYGRAIKLLESFDGQPSQSPESLVALANSYYKTEQPLKARRLMESLSTSQAEYLPLAFALARVAEDARDYLTAERLFRAIESRYVEPETVGYHLAHVLFQQGRWEESQQLLVETVRQGKATAATYNLLGHCYQQQNKVEEAMASFQKAIELQPDEALNYLEKLRLMARLNQWRAVLELSREATRHISRVPELYEVKGLAETMLLLTADAIQSFQLAVELDPKSARANLGLAVAQSTAGMTAEAESSFKRGLKLFPQDGLHYQEYGLMLLRMAAAGDSQLESRGISLLEQALKLNNNLSEAHYHLGQIDLQRAQPQAALQHLEIAARLEPGRSKILFALSRAYRNVGRQQDAERAFEKFQQLREVEENATPGFPAMGHVANPGSRELSK